MQENGTDQPRVYRRTRAMLKIRCTNVGETRHNYSQLTKSDTASASLFSESEERKEISADVPAPAGVPAPAPAPILETVKEQSHTPGSRKSMRKNLGRPASSYSDFYM